jgi:hypothetical protein
LGDIVGELRRSMLECAKASRPRIGETDEDASFASLEAKNYADAAFRNAQAYVTLVKGAAAQALARKSA